MVPNGSSFLKTLLLLQITTFIHFFFWIFLSMVLIKLHWSFGGSFLFLTIFFFFCENFKFTIVPIGKPKSPTILEKSNRRTKREMWDTWTVDQHIWGSFGLVVFKVIWCLWFWSENAIFKMLLLLRLEFFYSRTSCSCSFWQSI